MKSTQSISLSSSCLKLVAIALALILPSLARAQGLGVTFSPPPLCTSCFVLPYVHAEGVRPTSIVVRGSTVYFTDAANVYSPFAGLRSVSKDGTTVSTVSSEFGDSKPHSLISSSQYLYWVVRSPFPDNTVIRARSHATGVVTTVVSDTYSDTVKGAALSLVPGSTDGVLYANAYIGRLDQIVAGPPVLRSTLVEGLEPGVGFFYYPQTVTAHGTEAYFASYRGELYRIGLGGGTPTRLNVSAGMGTRLTTDSTNLYYTTPTGIGRYNFATRVASTLISLAERPSTILLDGTNLYFALPTAKTVWRLSLTSTANSWMMTGDTAPQSLATSSTRLYVGTQGQLVSVAK